MATTTTREMREASKREDAAIAALPLVSVAYNEVHTRAHRTHGWCAPVFCLRQCASLSTIPLPTHPPPSFFDKRVARRWGGEDDIHKRKWGNKIRETSGESVNGVPLSRLFQLHPRTCLMYGIGQSLFVNWTVLTHS
jgi:hypothetical protein